MNKKNTANEGGSLRIVLLAALAISMFMTIPRLAIFFYMRSLPFYDAGAGGRQWPDIFQKFLFGSFVAFLFLTVNISRKRLGAGRLVLDLGKFWQRLLLNLLLFILIRGIASLLGLDAAGFAFNQKFYGFLLNITLVLEISICILVSEGYMLMLKNQQMKINNESLQKLNAEVSFEALKNQVNPHFLFNSLTTIHSMIDSDPGAARQFVSNMSQVYRYVLQSYNTPLVCFREELAFSMAYVNMMRERYDNRFSVETNIDAISLTKQLPPMSLQILVENAFKHNIVSAMAPLNIQIIAKGNELIVENNLQERETRQPGTGLGLFNLNNRYQHLCGKEIRITRKDAVFSVALPLLNEIN